MDFRNSCLQQCLGAGVGWLDGKGDRAPWGQGSSQEDGGQTQRRGENRRSLEVQGSHQFYPHGASIKKHLIENLIKRKKQDRPAKEQQENRWPGL